MSEPVNEARIRRQIAQRLSLREPQENSLSILGDVLSHMDFSAETDPVALLEAIKAQYPTVADFEREFPSVCFSLATGVGKTRLMGAFIAYLYLSGRSKNFFVLAPNTTIYDKLIADFSKQSSPKYVFRGISQFAQTPPVIVTGDTWQEGRGIRGADLFGSEAIINIFNVDKINKEGGKIRSFRETLGDSYFDYLSKLPDLVLLMDEAHRYRAKAGAKTLFELNPKLGLELTATPKAVGTNKEFRNVIFNYGLGNAMADGFVKEPAVATRADFNPKDYDADGLEAIMLEDGVHYHEFVKTELELYSRQTGRKRVFPFMLVVAQHTAHASDLKTRIESDEFFKGAYKGRVIEVHSNTKGEESDDAMSRLVRLEEAGDTDIVIHVNKLKEGWDVTNLYTIVPLRASASDILTEQTLGRGLRLPYGERTGNEAVDTLTVIAHDRFDEVIKKAREADSIVQIKEYTIGEGGDITTAPQTVLTVPTAFEAALTGTAPQVPEGDDKVREAPAIFDTPEDRKVAQLTIDLIREKYERELKGGHKELKSPEVQKRIAEDVRRISKARQGTLEGIVTQPDVDQLVAVVTASIADNSIEIPEIVVLPSREVNFWFEDFDLSGISDIRFQPISDRLLVRNLRDQTQRELARALDGPREDRIENYIVRFLMDYPEVDYDSQADLLYKLAGQTVDHLRSYLQSEDDVENVALAQGKALAQRIMVQMKQHYRQTPAEYRATKVRSFRSLEPQNIAYSPAKSLLLTEVANPLSATPGYTFRGGQKSPYKFHKFHSDPERRFAVLIDSEFEKDVIRWLKPARNQFRIEYQPGKPYEPDFVVELSDRKLIAEIKAEREMDDPIVKEKARAAAEWIKHANEFAAEGDGKPWEYALIPDQAVTENATLAGLLARYGTTN